MLRQYSFIIFILSALCCRPAYSEINLALHKSYSLLPKPNYGLCTDALDVIQLTNGKTYGSRWTSKSTVGWQSALAIEIEIDLEATKHIDQVKVHSIGGGFAYVEFPEFIAVLVSNDGKTYGFAGLVGSEDLANFSRAGRQKKPHTFIIKNLNTQGRFIKIVVRPNGRYFFLDEIEVFGSKNILSEQVNHRKDLLMFGHTDKLLRAIEDYLQIKANIVETIRAFRNNRNRLSTDITIKVSSDLESLSQKCELPTDTIYSQEDLSVLGRQLGVVRAQIYKEIYKNEFVCFAANPMEMLFEKDMHFVDADTLQRIDIQMWKREYESAAVNIINCSQRPLDILVSASPLISEDSKKLDSSNIITVRRGIFVKALNVGSIADPLVLQSEDPFELQPGEVAQIWLTVFDPSLAAGDYKGALSIASSFKQQQVLMKTMNLNIKVADIIIPQNVSINTCAWDYFTPVSSVTKHILSTASKDLQAHYTNISVIHNSIIPFPRNMSRYDRFPKGMDFSKFDGQIQVNNFAKIYLLDFNFKSDRKDWGRFGEWMSPNWRTTFSAWLKILVGHLQKMGISYERFALYPFDESLCEEFYQLAKLIKDTDPKIQIFANNFGKGPKDFMRFKELVDIWCPHRRHCSEHPDWLNMVKSFGREVWTYGGTYKGPAKNYPSYGYYRLMAWDAFNRGQTGMGFYTYIDRQKHNWNDTLKPLGYYNVIYGPAESPSDINAHGEKIIPSRRWEAWREGIEDYEYLTQLQERIDNIRTSQPKEASIAQRILDSQVRHVLDNRDESGIVYSARQIISETIVKLKNSAP